LLKSFLGAVFFILLLADTSFCREARTVHVLFSRSLRPYHEALKGFKEGVRAQGYDVQYREDDISKLAGGEPKLIREINDSKPDAVLAIGTEAALLARDNVKETPVIFTMVLSPLESGVADSVERPGENITGVSLDIPIEEQFDVLKRVLPGIRKVGMLYDVDTKRKMAREASTAAAREGLTIIAKGIRSRTEISQGLDEVLVDADCLWGGVDPMIYNPSTASQIILTTIKKHVPFMAFSANFVRAGALMALECDYFEIGRQTAEVAANIFKGRKPSSIPVGSPKKTILVINMSTARNIGVSIPADLLKDAVILGE
jgi:putative ABC transport system substrate-binding protein